MSVKFGPLNFPRPIVFTEYHNPVYVCDYVVYLFGVDVTDHILGTLSWTLADKDGFNTASFSLNNAMSNFQVTFDNLGIDERHVDTFYNAKSAGQAPLNDESEIPASIEQNQNVVAPSFRKANDLNNFTYDETPKKEIMEAKKELDPSGRVYRLGPRNIVIHKNDTVRIFMRHPYINPNEEDLWLNVFTGYVDTIGKTGNYITGESEIAISCQDIRSNAQKLRVGLPTTPGDIKVTQAVYSRPGELFSDMLLGGVSTMPYSSLDFQSALHSLIVGGFVGREYSTKKGYAKPLNKTDGTITRADFKTLDEVAELNWERKEAPRAKGQFGIANFGFGLTLEYEAPTQEQIENNSAETANMDMFYYLGLYGMYGSPLSFEEVQIIGSQSGPEGAFAPHNQYLHFFLPKDLKSAKQLLKTEFITSSEQIDFIDRYNLIKELVDKVDYQFWVNGCGDIMIEFPMYDVDLRQYSPGIASLLTVDLNVIDDSVTDEGQNIISVLECTGETAQQDLDAQQDGTPEAFLPRVLVVSPALVSRIGVTTESQPILTQRLDRLKKLAEIEFNKRMAESSEVSVNFSWRPFFLPNKPLYHKTEERIGVSSSVSNNMSLFGECSGNVSIRYIRQLSFDSNNNPQFTFLTGGKSAAMSSARAWKDAGGTAISGTVVIDNSGKTVSSNL